MRGREALPPTPHALLLDAGNTVIFLDDAAVAAILRERGVDTSEARVRRAQRSAKREYEAFLGSGGSHADGWFVYMEALVRHAGAEPAHAGELARAIRVCHDERNLWRRVPEDLPAALERARASGIRLGIVSNSEGRVREILDDVGVGRFFEVVVDSGVEGVAKPDPEIWRRALGRMGVRARDAVYAGDVPSVDVDGARAAGLGAVLVDAFDDYAEYSGAARVRSVAELVAAWERM